MLLSINGQVMHPPADKFSWRGMTHRKEKSAYREKKKLLTVQRKKCLPRRENFAYQAEKKLLTAGCKISLPRTTQSSGQSDLVGVFCPYSPASAGFPLDECHDLLIAPFAGSNRREQCLPAQMESGGA